MSMEKNPYWMRKPKKDVIKRIEKIKEIIGEGVRTVRNITYKLYPNLHGKELDIKYNLTIKDTVRARTSRVIGFEQIRETRTRLHDYQGYQNVDDFIDSYMIDNLEDYYKRNKRPIHLKHFEVWFEKATVEPEFQSVCYKYDIPCVCVRGQAQWSTLNKGSKRDIPMILYFGDNDDKGYEILNVIKRDMKLVWNQEIKFVWCGITSEQEKKYKLPENSRIDVLELDDLKELVEDVIKQHIDMNMYQKILSQEERDKEHLRKFKAIVVKK